jgi:branched-chain amino acid transport system substrate-binding protein
VRSGEFDDSSRQSLVDAVQQTDLKGASGTVAFDEFGDTTNKVLTIYSVQGEEFVPLETGTFTSSS